MLDLIGKDKEASKILNLSNYKGFVCMAVVKQTASYISEITRWYSLSEKSLTKSHSQEQHIPTIAKNLIKIWIKFINKNVETKKRSKVKK